MSLGVRVENEEETGKEKEQGRRRVMEGGTDLERKTIFTVARLSERVW